MNSPNEQEAREPSGHDFDSEVTTIQDPDELFALVELEKLRKRTRRSVSKQQRAMPAEEIW